MHTQADEIMQPPRLLCSGVAITNCYNDAHCTINMYTYGYRKCVRLFTLDNYYLPVLLLKTAETTHPAHLWCYRMATEK